MGGRDKGNVGKAMGWSNCKGCRPRLRSVESGLPSSGASLASNRGVVLGSKENAVGGGGGGREIG